MFSLYLKKSEMTARPKKIPTVPCSQPGCDELVIGGLRHRYCFAHKGMAPNERKLEAKRLSKLRRKGVKDVYQEW